MQLNLTDPRILNQQFEKNGKIYSRGNFIRCLLMMPLGAKLLFATHPEYFRNNLPRGQ